MKVLLLQNVSKLGQKGEVKNVNDGYAHNFLLPNNLAKFVSEGEAKKLSKISNKIKAKESEQITKTKAILKNISGSKITLKEKTNNVGHLFARVHRDEILKAIINQLGIEIEKDWIKLSDPIKEVGEFDINIEAYGKKIKLKLFIEEK